MVFPVNWIKKIFSIISRKYRDQEKHIDPHSALEEWILTIEELVLLIRQARYEFSPTRLTAVEYDEYDLFEANSILYQVDRLVNKIREYILILQSYNKQFSNNPEVLRNIEFVNANRAGFECYQTMVRLIFLFQKLATEKEKRLSNEFISQAQGLEQKCSALRQAVWHLNQYVMHYELKTQLNKLTELSDIARFSEKLKLKAREVSSEQDHFLLLNVIAIFDLLGRSSAVLHTPVVKQTLKGLFVNIELLIGELSRKSIQKDGVFSCLYLIFNQIESLRFVGNRKNIYAKDLFDKAKLAKRSLRKACMEHPLGKEFLEKTTFHQWQPMKNPTDRLH